MRNKKGLSTVVTTLIIILLVFVAIGIVWAVVQGVLDRGAKQAESGLDCATTQLGIESFKKIDTDPATDTTLDSYEVIVSRDATGVDMISSVVLVFSDGDTTQTKTLTKDKGDIDIALGKLGKVTFNVAFTDAALENMDDTATSVEVAAIIEGATCNPSGSKNI